MDMLVNLYDLNETLAQNTDYQIKRILSPNIYLLENFIKNYFSEAWASETKASCYKSNPTCFIAVKDEQIVGFACFDATTKGFFGPLGVHPNYRKQGIARQLILRTLYAMTEDGYAYAVIGGVSDRLVPFYKKVCNAIEIPFKNQVYTRMI